MNEVKNELGEFMNIVNNEVTEAWGAFKRSKERGDDPHLIDCAWLRFHTLYKLKKKLLKKQN